MKLLLTLIVILFAPAARAQDNVPAPLPPPILVPNVNPPLTIPSEMVADLQNGRQLCERKRAKFDINLNHLTRADINGDGVEDFIMSSAGYQCNGTNIDFIDMNGNDYTLFTSLPGGRYLPYTGAIHAYDVQIDREFTPPHIVFRVQCPHKLDLQNFGYTRLRWNGTEIKSITRNAGCDGNPPDDKAIALSAKPATEAPAPKVVVEKAPPREFDVTAINDESRAAAQMEQEQTPAPETTDQPAEEITDVTSPMTPEPAEPEPESQTAPEPPPAPVAAPAVETPPPAEEQPATPTPVAAQPAPVPAKPASTPQNPNAVATLPGATYPTYLSPRPEDAPRKPASLKAEDILATPAKPLSKPIATNQ
jgi:hypothetical protein